MPHPNPVEMANASVARCTSTTPKDVVTFYVQRDTNPDKWYPLNADGTVHKLGDLPPRFRGNVTPREGPYNRRPGDTPALPDTAVVDVVAVLKTLSGGWQP